MQSLRGIPYLPAPTTDEQGWRCGKKHNVEHHSLGVHWGRVVTWDFVVNFCFMCTGQCVPGVELARGLPFLCVFAYKRPPFSVLLSFFCQLKKPGVSLAKCLWIKNCDWWAGITCETMSRLESSLKSYNRFIFDPINRIGLFPELTPLVDVQLRQQCCLCYSRQEVANHTAK